MYEGLKESVRQKHVWQQRKGERNRDHGPISASWAAQQINEAQNAESVVSRESKFKSTILRLLKLIHSVIHLIRKISKGNIEDICIDEEGVWLYSHR